jgi:serine/threonine protein kinase
VAVSGSLRHDLNDRGQRLTPQRQRVLDLFERIGGGHHLSAEDVHLQLLRADNKVSLATVYRTLRLLSSMDLLRELELPEGSRRFELATALRIAAGVASAARHLHRQGVLHGDLYAHNTLTTAQGQAKLGDFGAASLYLPDDVGLGEKLQRLEARAFGCLLEELLERVDAWAAPLLTELKTLQARCLGNLPADRPLFAEIEAALLQAQSRLAA